MRAKEKANSILEKYPYIGSNWIYDLLGYFGIVYLEEPLERASTIIIGIGDRVVIIVDKNSPSSKKREYIAHELGHFFFHTGNEILYKEMNPLLVSKDERRVQDFALYLLIPEGRLRELLDVLDPPSLEDLADEFSVTVEFMKERLEILGR